MSNRPISPRPHRASMLPPPLLPHRHPSGGGSGPLSSGASPSTRTTAALGKHERPGSPQPPAPTLPSSSPPASIRGRRVQRWGNSPRDRQPLPGGSTTSPAAPHLPRHRHHPLPPLHHPLLGRSAPPHRVSLGASDTWKTTARGKQTRPSSPQPFPSTTSALLLLSTIHQEVGAPPVGWFGAPSDIHRTTAVINQSFPGPTLPRN